MSQKDLPLITHRNAALSFEARRRLVARCQTRPIAHVAAEAGVSRACLSKWVNRHRQLGDDGLLDRTSRPHRSPSQTPPEVITQIEKLRRKHKWSARLITAELHERGITISQATVGRWLQRLGLNQRRHLDIDGTPTRVPGKIIARYPGHMLHVDVKKVGRIRDGGGWRIHGRGSTQDKAKHRNRVGYTHLHSAVDGYSRLAYTEALPDEKATTTIGFITRARAWFAAHGISHVTRLVTDNGPAYKSHAFNRAIAAWTSQHQYTRIYTPRHNGKVERYNRILADEVLYARPYQSETERTRAILRWNIHYNYHRPHTACRNQPPAARTPARVTNLLRSNT